MNSLPSTLIIALLLGSAQAQTATPIPKAAPSPTPAPKPGKFVSLSYPVRDHGSPSTRQDGDAGSRGWGVTVPSVYVLAPNHTGLTTRGQPSLFWYQSGPASTRIEITITEPGRHKPLLRVGADKADQGGIHRIPLARYNITLTPGVLYQWAVALSPDPANRSRDVVALDTIRRIEPDAQLKAALAGSKGLGTAAVYANNGIWYDALEAVSNEIDAAQRNKEIRLLRASLLAQAGLRRAAAFDGKE